jgi:hypothetical protein
MWPSPPIPNNNPLAVTITLLRIWGMPVPVNRQPPAKDRRRIRSATE